MIERMLDELNLRNAVPVSDAWETITCRIERRMRMRFRQGLQHRWDAYSMTYCRWFGHPCPNSSSLPSSTQPVDHLDVQTTQNTGLPELVDLGLVPWEACSPG